MYKKITVLDGVQTSTCVVKIVFNTRYKEDAMVKVTIVFEFQELLKIVLNA